MIRTLVAVVRTGAAAGALAGALECLSSLVGPASVLVPSVWWEVVANYVLVGAALSVLAFPVVLVLPRESRLRLFSAGAAAAVALFLPALLLHRRVLRGMGYVR